MKTHVFFSASGTLRLHDGTLFRVPPALCRCLLRWPEKDALLAIKLWALSSELIAPVDDLVHQTCLTPP